MWLDALRPSLLFGEKTGFHMLTWETTVKLKLIVFMMHFWPSTSSGALRVPLKQSGLDRLNDHIYNQETDLCCPSFGAQSLWFLLANLVLILLLLLKCCKLNCNDFKTKDLCSQKVHNVSFTECKALLLHFSTKKYGILSFSCSWHQHDRAIEAVAHW